MRISPVSTSSFTSTKQTFKPAKPTKFGVIAASTACMGIGAASLYYYKTGGLRLTNSSAVKSARDNFLCICKEGMPEFYCASPENVASKTFKYDLHSHSNHSDGWGLVPRILDQVAQYADSLYEKTGEMFTFALTDHDRVSGVTEALNIIKANQKKYRHVRFIPGVELSFTFASGGKVQAGEILAYNIDPESKAMKTLVEDVNKNRLEMINSCIEKLGAGFKRSDLNNYFLNEDGETFAYYLHLRLRNYAQIKGRINKIAAEWNENPDSVYKRLMDDFVFSNGRIPKPSIKPEGFDEYLKKKNITTKAPMIDSKIEEICENFYPKIINGQVQAKTENSFQKIIDTLKDEEDIVLGFAHPYFTAEKMVDFRKEFDSMLKYAKGRIELSENYHQAYPDDIDKNMIKEINSYLLEKGLIPIGGRDNHKPDFLTKK